MIYFLLTLFLVCNSFSSFFRHKVKLLWDFYCFWGRLKEMGISDHLTCLLRNLHAGQEATVRTGHGTTDWFQIRKGIRQGCILSPCLFNLYAECIMRNAGLDETQARIKIAGRNIQPWHTPFPIWNQSVVPCLILTVASWPAYRFLGRQVRWSDIPISLRIFHSLLWSTQSRLWDLYLCMTSSSQFSF